MDLTLWDSGLWNMESSLQAMDLESHDSFTFWYPDFTCSPPRYNFSISCVGYGANFLLAHLVLSLLQKLPHLQTSTCISISSGFIPPTAFNAGFSTNLSTNPWFHPRIEASKPPTCNTLTACPPPLHAS